MPVLQAQQLADLVATTLRELNKPSFVDISSDLQRHTVNNFIRQNRVELQSGTGVQWSVMVNHNGSARNVGLGGQDEINRIDTMTLATADWRNSVASYSFIGQEIAMNREPARIVNIVKQGRHACMVSLAELMEGNLWGPPVAFTDAVTPWGIKTWIVKNASEGFNGGAPSGYTVIGLNPTTYPRFKNYTFPYTNVTPDDFIAKLDKAATFCDFMPAVEDFPNLVKGVDWGFFTNYAVIGALQQQLRAQNENLGADIDKYSGGVRFRRMPVTWVPKLEADTTGPFYGINYNTFKTIILDGWWLNQTDIAHYPGQHTTEAHFLDSTYQWCCYDRRANFVGSTGTSEPS